MSPKATLPKNSIRRKSPAAVEARERLLETAERLLADHGIDGVSLRQIAAESGNANNSVIQYHFGDKAGLIREIILRRVARFEARRRDLMASAEADGRTDDIRALLEILFLPIAEATDAEGRHIYARFLMQFLTRFQYQAGIQHPGWSPDSAASRAVTLLAGRLAFLSPQQLEARINRIGGLFFNALVDRDNAAAQRRAIESGPDFEADLFAMMAAAIAAAPQI